MPVLTASPSLVWGTSNFWDLPTSSLLHSGLLTMPQRARSSGWLRSPLSACLLPRSACESGTFPRGTLG
eukprot:4777815-Alexandrium_andersonii.AAC.1